jgi:AraC-like DNA-binding protein
LQLNYKIEECAVTELVCVAHKAKRRDFELKQHAHSFHEVIYVDYGNLLLEMEDSDIVIKSGYVVFIAEGQSHKFHGIAGAPFDFLNICYAGILPESISNTPIKIGALERNLLKRIKDEVADDLPYSKDIAVNLLIELIYLLCRQDEMSASNPEINARNSELYRSAVVQQTMIFIAEHFAESNLLDKSCSKAGLSKSYLRALIKKETGYSFGYHLQKVRSNIARRMLLESSMSLKEIANYVGYQSLPFFFKMFRRSTGMSPMEYAKSLGEPDEKS